MERDAFEHVLFCPIQSKLGQQLCAQHNMPVDVSTAVLIDGTGAAHKESDAVLLLLPWMSFPFPILGRIALYVPRFIRDPAYRCFAAHRGRQLY